VLLVDDSEFDRIAFREAFQNTDVQAQVTECDNAEDALALLKEDHSTYDIVVSDYKMPGMSGLDLCVEITKRGYGLPTVLLTGQGNEELVIEALKSGISDYFVKDLTLGYQKLLPVKLPEVVARFYDRQARRHAEEALENQFRLTAYLLSAIPTPVFYMDIEGGFLGCNPAYEEFSGRSAEELEGRKIFELVPPEEAQLYREQISTLTNSPGERIVREEEVGDHRGGMRTVLNHKTTFSDVEGKLAGIICVITDITERKNTERELETYRHHLEELVQERTKALRKSEKKFRDLSAKMGRIEQQERQRIASGLHDGLAQDIALSKIKLQTVRQQIPDPAIKGQLGEIVGLMDISIQKLKSLVFELYPPILFELGLEAAVERFIENFQVKHNLNCKLIADRHGKPLSNHKAEILYNAIRELLMNVIKHACAQNVDISILRKNGNIQITVKDDGVGFKVPTESPKLVEQSGFGLFSVKDRVEAVGGNLAISSVKSKGSRITLTAPLDAFP